MVLYVARYRCHGSIQTDNTGLQNVRTHGRLLHDGLCRAEDALPNKGGQDTAEHRAEPKHPRTIHGIPGGGQREGMYGAVGGGAGG